MVELINKPRKVKKIKRKTVIKNDFDTMSKAEKAAHTEELLNFFKAHRKPDTKPQVSKKILTTDNEIKKNAYAYSDISSLNISNKIVVIRRFAFVNCKYLKKIVFGENSKIERIEPGAFRGCPKLKTIIFPNKIIKIYDVNIDISKLNKQKMHELIELLTKPIKFQKKKIKPNNKPRIKYPESTSPNEAKGRHYHWYRPK